MYEKWNSILERIKSRLDSFDKEKGAKNARITYGVVWNLLLIAIIAGVVGASFVFGIGAGYFASLTKDVPVTSYAAMKKDIYNYEATSNLYFSDNVYLGKLKSDLDREEVKISDVSDYLKKAIVATEDEHFYDHKGVVPKAIMRAVYQEFSNSAVQSGGSTLTQQLVKNQILTNEVSFDRKAKEVLLALRLEKSMKKDEILEAYLNAATFGRNSSGRNIAGVQTAAKGIFGVTAKELTLPQAAFIAGLPQSPFGYTPFTNKGELKEPENLEPGLNRMKTVLGRMLRENYITEKEYRQAIRYDITKDFIPKQQSPSDKYPWLTAEIEERAVQIMSGVLAAKDGYSEKDLEKDSNLKNKYITLADRDMRQSGYNIHTTINKKVFEQMQKAKDSFNGYGPVRKVSKKNPETGKMELVDEPVQLGAMMIENKTGRILSFVGGRDFKLNQLNHATKGDRQNGSTMKPLLVYAPAMELGKSAPGAVLADAGLELPAGNGKVYSPGNYTSRYYGLVSARFALAHSYNVSAIRAYMDIIDQRPMDYLKKMGFSNIEEGDYHNLSAALGGIRNGVTVEENVNAYATFANGGKFIDAYLIEKITDSQGKLVYEHKSQPVDVFSPQTSYLMIDMMRDVLKYGTAASVPGMLKFSSDWAGKTGTTNNYHDSWIVASNPNITFGTWIGYDTPYSLEASGWGDYNVRNYRIWSKLMNAAYDADPNIVSTKERFKMPGGIVSRQYCAISGLLPSEACSKAGLVQSDIYNVKFVPTETDDSLISSRYVIANGKKYLALDSTPAEFSHAGMILNPDFVKRITRGNITDTSQLFPDKQKWAHLLVADARLADDGKAPAAVRASLAGGVLSWTASASPDVVGYRVYTLSGQRVSSVGAGSSLAARVGAGSYYVVAVDVAGRESAPSNTAAAAGKPPKNDSGQEKPDKPKDPSLPKDPPPGGDEEEEDESSN